MISIELIEQLRKLNSVEKLEVIEILTTQLADEENNLIKPGASYEVWFPNDATEAAHIMLEALKKDATIDYFANLQ
ncbi:hypothetical protein NIES4071_10620 [Calothrix sp. NIES-4071]|nr:hypothetical protein NIES4071_10620 [Calothrix sp. NIES-4071]BAZ55403.1 hypothetical protein NIES4105_10580 [Calothrix sp. NIES-4105]